jgi:tetratricopeptide (TPR) repeat protein
MIAKRLGYLSLIMAISLLTSCQQELYKSNNKYNIPEKSTEEPLVQFLIQPTNYSAILETENLAKAYDYAKIAHQTLWINQFNEKLNIAPSTRVVTIHETTGLNDIGIDSLLKFVSKGGTLFVTKAIKDERMSFFFGMTPDADWSTNLEASGLYFKKPLFPGMQGQSFDNKTVHRGFDSANFSSNVNVLVAANNNNDYPVIIENRVGNGKVVLYNSSEILKKEMRGLLFASSLLGLEGIPYPIANIGTLFLDDFPTPVYNDKGDAIILKNGDSKSEFLKSDWWPKMKELAEEQDIKYTAYVTFNSNKKINGDIEFNSWDKSRLLDGRNADGTNSWIENEFIKQGHELGLRGYNDLPLLNNLWKDTDLELDVNKATEKKWKESVSNNLPVSYAPPNNEIDSLGLISLKKGFPSLNYMHTSFLGDLDKGGNREFDPDPLNNRFFDYPRLSSGYKISAREQWALESTYLYTGIWSHTLNTKDVIDSGSALNAISSLKNHIVDYKKRHPYIQFLSAKKSSETVMDWRYQSVRHLNFEGQYEVSSSINADAKKDSYWLMYIDSKNDAKLTKKLTDDQVNFTPVPLLNGFLYNIKTNSPNISVPDIRPEIRALIGTTSSLITKIYKDYKAFNKNKETMVPLKEKIDRLVADEKSEQALELMEELFEDNKFINTQQIVAYAKFMKQQGKTKELWDQIDKMYLKNPSASYADFSRRVSSISNYPSTELKKLWMERQMEWGKEDIFFLKDYYNAFNTKQNANVIEQVLEVLYTKQPSLENRKTYFDFLINTKSAKLLSKLDEVEPCSISDKELATSISNAYAERLNFDKAIEWQKCGLDISPDIVNEWKKKSNSIEDKKSADFPYFIKYLMVNDRDRAIEEMQNIVACRADLDEISGKIATLFSEYAQFEKALDWSTCSKDIPIKNILDWNLEAGNTEYLKQIYEAHISKNPRDFDTMNHMAKLLLLNGDVDGAGEIAIEIPPTKLDPDFKIAFNNEVKAETGNGQSLYIRKFKILMDDAIVRKSAIETRKKKGHSIGFSSSAVADKFKPTLFSNFLHFGFYNKKFDMHRFSIAQGTAYSVLKDTIVLNDIDRDLLGVEYLYKTESNLKSPIHIGARVELDNFNKLFIHFKSGIDFIGKSNKTSLELKANPVTTGPGYDLNIYDVGVKAAQEFKYSSNLKHIFSVKGDYYTDSQYYATGGTRLEYNLINLDKFKLGPLAEGAYAVGSEDRRNGFPYWLTKDRLYAGGGLLLQVGDEDSAFNLKSDFSIFAEKDEPSFQRYEGALSYRIKDFTTINLNYTYYTIDQFFSNAFQLGIQYNFK